MTNLGIAGAVSLRTVNQWISVIDTNLTNSKRIGYKESRVALTSGEVSRSGTTQSIGKIQDITFPSASLEIGKTQILDYVQGNLTQTGQIADFALSGRGYFVVEDKFGNKYATRDGQFNFDTDGYLVTAEGLRVLTTGLDYIRVPASERYSVNTEGRSEVTSIDPSQINTTFNPVVNASSLSNSIYGMKKLLVIDIPTESKLMYSKYGYTKFDIGSKIPIRVQNDFSQFTDGIDTSLIPDSLVDAGFATGTSPQRKMSDYFKHDVKNSTLKMSPHDIGGSANRYVQAAVTSQKIKDFNLSLDFYMQDSAPSFLYDVTTQTAFGVTFGKNSHSSTDLDSYFVGLRGGVLEIRKNNVLITSTAVANVGIDTTTATSFTNATKLTLKLDIVNGFLNAQVLQNDVSISGAGVTNLSLSDYEGYMSLGNTVNHPSPTSPGGAPDNIISIKNIDLVERNKDSEYVTNIIHKNKKDILKNGLNADYEETQVMQQYVEESTATIADTIPMLSNAQKLFTAISKIISVYNSITDDMNNTIR
jgi:flagellar hook-basal body protein